MLQKMCENFLEDRFYAVEKNRYYSQNKEKKKLGCGFFKKQSKV